MGDDGGLIEEHALHRAVGFENGGKEAAVPAADVYQRRELRKLVRGDDAGVLDARQGGHRVAEDFAVIGMLLEIREWRHPVRLEERRLSGAHAMEELAPRVPEV